ncbi:hypothetical protein BJX99DRAFT_225243 [Aspergillus californicus]
MSILFLSDYSVDFKDTDRMCPNLGRPVYPLRYRKLQPFTSGWPRPMGGPESAPEYGTSGPWSVMYGTSSITQDEFQSCSQVEANVQESRGFFVDKDLEIFDDNNNT